VNETPSITPILTVPLVHPQPVTYESKVYTVVLVGLATVDEPEELVKVEVGDHKFEVEPVVWAERVTEPPEEQIKLFDGSVDTIGRTVNDTDPRPPLVHEPLSDSA
jgi:hypothetical protein